MRLVVSGLVSLALGSVAAAEPCPVFGLESKPLRADAVVSTEGGIVVGEVPEIMMIQGRALTPDRSGWKVRTTTTGKVPARPQAKATPATADVIAPGLVVYRPPSGARAYVLLDGDGKRTASAKVEGGKRDPLAAPDVTAVISGTSRGRHPSVFVNVELATAAPPDAVALVIGPAKGPARSWGPIVGPGTTINVYSTAGGCVSTFPEGTVASQPGDPVIAFWVDAWGRRSRVSPVVIVAKAP